MDALDPYSGIEEIGVMKATQLGVTEVGNNWIFHTVDIAPCSMMAVFPTDNLAQKHSKQKLSPAIEATPQLEGKILPRRVRDGENTILGKSFPNGYLWMSGSNSGANFRSMSVKNCFFDDIDGFEIIPGEGDPLSLGKKRTDSYGARRKIFYNSTPTLKGASFIDEYFQSSDQRYYNVPCPLCGTYQRLEWGGKNSDFGIKFERDEDGIVIDVYYQCRDCKGRIDEHHKTRMLRDGKWIPTYPNRPRRGYQISSLYSPAGWVSWKQVVEEFLEAVGNPEKMKTWVNTRKGEPYEEKGEQPEWTILKARAEPYEPMTVPRGVRLLSAGVDVMDTYFSLLVVGWGALEEAWIIHYAELYGDPEQKEIWEQLDGLLYRAYDAQEGGKMNIVSAAVDSGGHHTQAVYRYARDRQPVVMACQGASQANAPLLRKPTKQDVAYMGSVIKGGVLLWSIGTDVAKSTIYSRFGLTKPGPGYIHFPIGYPDNLYQELTAEKHVDRLHKGYIRKEWVQIRDRNHALDDLVYAYGAAVRAGAHTLNEPSPAGKERKRVQEKRKESFVRKGGSSWVKKTGKKWV
jgi:phage terminase large subunit GpA-like protein